MNPETSAGCELDDDAKLLLMNMAGYKLVNESMTWWLKTPDNKMFGLGTKRVDWAIHDGFQTFLNLQKIDGK